MSCLETIGQVNLCVDKFSLCDGFFLLISLQNDMLSWLMDEARGEQRTVEALAQRMLSINFVAIHTSSMVNLTIFFLQVRPPS